MLEIKKGVQPPIILIISAVANAAEELGITLRITSGIDGQHSEWSGHYQLRCVDVGSKEHSIAKLPSIVEAIRREMNEVFPPHRVYIGIHSKGDRGSTGNEHIHVQFK